MAAHTIFVGSLPVSASNERLEEIFSEVGPVKQCFVVKNKGTDKCQGYGFVTFSMADDAQRALKEVKDYDGQKVSLSVAKKKIRDRKKKTAGEESAAAPEDSEPKPKIVKRTAVKARLIIRNLSFKCTETELKETFGAFGTVVNAYIPLKPDGKMRGFGFVLFKNVSGAAKALNAMNLKDIKGRQVAVDWAVPKENYIATHQPSSSDKNKTEQADAKSDSDSEDEEEKPAAPEKKKVISKKAVQQKEESSDEDDSMEQDSEHDESDDEENEDEDSADGDEDGDEDGDDESNLDSNDDQDESLDGEDEEDEDDKPVQKKKKRLLPSDVKDGKTVFIRNLSFDTEEEGLEEALLLYGELNYIKIVLHPDTEHSKGCAFAQFKTKEDADKCIAAAQEEAENGGLRVDGRKLLVVAAVSRGDAVKLKVNKAKVETGSRNIYLAREGLIRAGTKAAEGVSESDMIKRTRFEEVKRTKLRDISVFVSKTRLCVHNLPKSVDSKKLKTFCFQALKGVNGVRITECRVMYDRKPEKGQVVGQSLGYGFVQFQEHEHALNTLRHLNNNPNIFGSNKRPIVEFSLEDLRKLKVKEMRQQKNKEMVRNQPSQGGSKPQTVGDGKGPKTAGNKAQSSRQAGREKGVSERQKPDKNYTGFHTKPEVEHIDLENGKKRRKVLAMPSHRGPKIRMRDKGKQQAPPPKKGKAPSNRNKYKKQQIEKPTQSKNQVKMPKKQFKRRDGDRFDSLVEKYKSKLMGNNTNPSIKRSKWFDS